MHAATPPLWVLGESLMDCVAQADGSLKPLLGGSPYNLACAAALQGMSVGMVNPFSTDTFGDALLARLQATGAQALLPRSRLPTALAVVHVRDGQPSYGFYREGIADRDYQVAEVQALLRSSPPGVLHTGSLMAMPPEHSKALAVVADAKALGWTISVDVNLRPRLASDLTAYLHAVRELAALADWLKASDEDLELLGFDTPSLDTAPNLAAHWMAQGCTRVALTFGAQGAYVQVGAAHAQGPAPRVDVIDTVGAGDTFWGNCLADWLQHNTLNAPDVAAARVSTTLQRALMAAAINCTRQGCQPPHRGELMDLE